METDASSCVSDNSGYPNFLAYLSGSGVTSNLKSSITRNSLRNSQRIEIIGAEEASVVQSKVEAPSSTNSTSEGELKEHER